MKNEIKYRYTRKVDINKQRVVIGAEAVKSLGLEEKNNDVIVTVYDNKIVITKRR